MVRSMLRNKRPAEHGFGPSRRSAEHGFVPPRRSAEHGFTLIELLVALAIFSMAAVALLRLEGVVLASTATLQDRLIGQIVARNVAVLALTDPRPPVYGEVAGGETNAGRAWRWTRIVAPTPETGVQRIDIAVIDDTGRPAGGLTVFRAVVP